MEAICPCIALAVWRSPGEACEAAEGGVHGTPMGRVPHPCMHQLLRVMLHHPADQAERDPHNIWGALPRLSTPACPLGASLTQGGTRTIPFSFD
eukprot:2359804-Pyramimonas_sp.AAC.1